MKRVMLTLAVCAIGSFALTASAQAAGDPTTGAAAAGHGQSRAAKTPKPKVYEWCGTASGCGYETDLWSKTKTFGFFGSPVGTYTKGPKGAVTLDDENTGCFVYLKKDKGTKNYSGVEPGSEGCSEQEVVLTYVG